MKKNRRFIAVTVAIVILTVGIVAGSLLFHKIRTRHPLRPTLCDRTGRELLTDRRKFLFAKPVRQPQCGGTFAAAVLGHTVVKNGQRVGAAGVEHLIDRRGIRDGRLFLTLDAGIQEKCEVLLDRIFEYAAPEYAYVTVLDADGALAAAAQRPVIDLADRRKVAPRGMVFMASTYVFPIPDAWMRLLGSRSDAPPEEKLKLGFNRKTGLFPGEGRGVIPGSGPNGGGNGGAKNHAQSANALKFLLAYIGAAEKKPIPELKLLLPDTAPRPRLQVAGETQWLSMRWSPDRSALSALGTAPVWGGAELYILLRIGFPRPLPAKYRATLETMIRHYPGAPSAVDYLNLQEMRSEIVSAKLPEVEP